MGTRIVVTVDSHGVVTVLTDSPGVQVFVIDRDVAEAPMQIVVDGAPAAVDSLLDGLARVDATKVNSVFSEVATQLPAAEPNGVFFFSQKHRAQLRNLSKALAGTGPAAS